MNGAARVGLIAVNGATGAVVPGFVNNMSGGIGVNGLLTVQQLKLTHDDTKLLVVHTGRKIANQDRYGVGLISTQTNQLLPWRTRLWDDNLQYVGGIQRVYAGDIASNDQYFVVGSGSGGDRPPINDTAVAFPVAGNDNVQPLWVSRHFDSVYSVAVTERAVYVGGHFGFQESPTAPERVQRVQVEIQDRNTKQYLQDNLTTWGAVNNIYASLATANATSTAWSLPVTITGTASSR